MGPKRKAESELSENPNTKRVRARRDNMDGNEAIIDKAKRADSGAITYSFSKLKKTSEYLAASEAEQKQLREADKARVIAKRKVDGVHASIVETSLGIGQAGGAYAQFDDGNPAWEDIEEEDEVTLEALWRADEAENGEIAVGNDQDIKEAQQEMSRQRAMKLRHIGFKTWKRKWNRAHKSLLGHLRSINMDPQFLEKLQPAIDPQTQVYYERVPPHLFFTLAEIALWRNINSWVADEGEITLPGPAEWWPDDYDAIGHGFTVSEANAQGYHRAWEMLREESEPKDFSWVLPSETELMVMPMTKESEDYLKAFFED